jgi:transcriptional regulator GlxA family with amidase domain
LGNGSPQKPVDSVRTFMKNLAEGLKLVRFGGGGEITRFVCVGLSRTRLAERFRHFLEESPMAYLTKWRLKVGAEILQSTEESVAEVAAAVGYGSEAAFNRAFKREFAYPPAQFRRKRRVPSAERS